MLAKNNKIKTLMKQRSFIEKGLSLIPEREDGDPSFRYVGHVYAENRDYFFRQGYHTQKVDTDAVLMATKGYPIWIFVPRDDAEMLLSEEEMEEAQKYLSPVAISEEEIDKHAEVLADAMLASLFGEGAPPRRVTAKQAEETAAFFESLLNGNFPGSDAEVRQAAEAVGKSFLDDLDEDDDSDFDEEDF